ncbi:low molecular weight phosphatase family protein [Streptomyces sp. NPDC050658]|uniref:arsenate reductase/protein-tyrosine-phosphatase family protein n=1 Tax=unclassified Streptomyces TaxID=2593676 RepID=UPI00341C2D56
MGSRPGIVIGSQPASGYVLFVCTGNICRSPLAARLLTARADTPAVSAGTSAVPGSPMDPAMSDELVRLGGNPDRFAARRLDARMVAGARLVLGLAREHREAAVRLAPTALARCFTLAEYIRVGHGPRTPAARPEDDDVLDPYGKSRACARRCADRISVLVNGLVPLLAEPPGRPGAVPHLPYSA